MADLSWKKLVDDAKFHWDGCIYRKDTYGEGTELYPTVYRIGTISDGLSFGLIEHGISMYKLTGQAVYLTQAKATADFLDANMLHPTTNIVCGYTRSAGKDLSGATYSNTATALSHIADLAKIDSSYNPLVVKLADAIVNYHFSALDLPYRSLYPDGTVASNTAVLPNNQSGASVGHISIALLKAYEVTGTESYKTAVYDMLVAFWNEKTAVDLISDRINADTGEDLELFTRQYAIATYMSSLLFYYYLTKDTTIYNIIKDYSSAINTYIWLNDVHTRWIYRTYISDGSGKSSDKEMNDQYLNDVMFRAYDINTELGSYEHAKVDAKLMYYPQGDDVDPNLLIKHKGNLIITELYMRTQLFAVNYDIQRIGKDDDDNTYHNWLGDHYSKVVLFFKKYYGGGGYQSQLLTTVSGAVIDKDDNDALCGSSITQLVNFATYFMIKPSSGVKVVWDSIGDFSLESVCRHIGYAGYDLWFDKVHFDYDNRKITLDDVTGSGTITFLSPIASVKKDGVEYTNFSGKVLTITEGSSYVIYLIDGGGGKWKYDLDEEFNSGFHNDTEAISDEIKLEETIYWDFEEDCVDDSDWAEIGSGGYLHDNGDDAGIPEGEFELHLGMYGGSNFGGSRSPTVAIGDSYATEIRCKPISQGTERDMGLYFEFRHTDATDHNFVICFGSDGIYIKDKDGSWDKHALTMPTIMTTWKFVVTITGGDRTTATVECYQDGVLQFTHTDGLPIYALTQNWRFYLYNINWSVDGTWRIDWIRYEDLLTVDYKTTGDWITPLNSMDTKGWISQINIRYKIKDANYNISKIKMIAKTTMSVPAEGDWGTPTDELTEGTDYILTKDNAYHECRIPYSKIWHTDTYEYFFFRVYMTGDGADTPLLDWIEMIYGAISALPNIFDAKLSKSSITQDEEITVECDINEMTYGKRDAYVEFNEQGNLFKLDTVDDISFEKKIKSCNISAGDNLIVKIKAFNENGSDMDETNILTVAEADDSIILQVCDEIVNILQNDARLDDVNDNDIKIGKEEDMRNVARVIGFPAILVIPGSDDIEPISVAKEKHTMTVYVMPIHKGYDDAVDIRSIINLGDGVYDALIEKQNLNGKAERVFITKDDPSYISRKNSVLYSELLKCEIWKITMGAT